MKQTEQAALSKVPKAPSIHLQFFYNSKNPTDVQQKSKIKKRIFSAPVRKGKKKIIRRGKRHKQQKKNVGIFLEKKFLRLALLSNKTKERKKKPPTIHIQSTHNNTIYTLSHGQGMTNYSVSTGMCGFKNTRKSTSYASQMAAEKLAGLIAQRIAQRRGKKNFCVKVKGLGPGKLSGVRALHQFGIRISKIRECTGLPHNGCRSPKCRRV